MDLVVALTLSYRLVPPSTTALTMLDPGHCSFCLLHQTASSLREGDAAPVCGLTQPGGLNTAEEIILMDLAAWS